MCHASRIPENVSPKVLQDREDLLSRLRDVAQGTFGEQTSISVFGSTVIPGFSDDKSDLDLTVDSGECFVLNKKQKNEALKRLCKMLRKTHQSLKCEMILGAKIPIIKIWDPHTQLQADMSVQNDLPVYKSRLIAAYCQIDPRFQRLALVVKRWAAIRG